MNKIDDVAKGIRGRAIKRWKDINHKPTPPSETPQHVYHPPIMAYEERLEENNKKKALKHFEQAMDNENKAVHYEENNNPFLASFFHKNAFHHALKFKEYANIPNELFETYNWGKIKRPDWLKDMKDSEYWHPLGTNPKNRTGWPRASEYLGKLWAKEKAEGKRDEHGNRISPTKPRGRPRKS